MEEEKRFHSNKGAEFFSENIKFFFKGKKEKKKMNDDDDDISNKLYY